MNSLGGDFSIIEGAIRLKKAHGTFIAWNPGNLDLDKGLKKIGKYLKHIDVFIVNQEEASGLLGIPYNEEAKLFKKFDKIVPGLAIMTKGHDGLTVGDGRHMWTAGVYKEKYITDRTGAGDSFCSGFVSGLHHALKKKNKITGFRDEFSDADIEFAIKLGSANGTSKVEHMGAKGGLLYKKDLKDKRWKNLKIKKISID
jgi:sugar/nucleoside kinase (ribokinase family)